MDAASSISLKQYIKIRVWADPNVGDLQQWEHPQN